MLVLFRCFLTFFLGLDASRAERLTDLQAWSNPIAQVRLLGEETLEKAPAPGPIGAAGKHLGQRSGPPAGRAATGLARPS